MSEMGADRASQSRLPRMLGRYALYEKIASGGMASVHIGRLLGPVGFARTVAVKRMHPQFAEDPEFVSMFIDEARLAARIRHPNVGRVGRRTAGRTAAGGLSRPSLAMALATGCASIAGLEDVPGSDRGGDATADSQVAGDGAVEATPRPHSSTSAAAMS